MSEDFLITMVIGGLVLMVFLSWFLSNLAKRHRARNAADEKARNETLFKSMFPELQPYFHPERLVEYVDARTRRKPNPRGKTDWEWNNPPGFPGVLMKCSATEKGERVLLCGQDGGRLGEFKYEAAPAIGVMRVGKGKLTIDLNNRPAPRVRYWHPEREFKWSLKGWVFKTPMADDAFSSDSSSFSSSSSSSSSDSRVAAAAFAGAGGAFDGGGAAGGWDAGSPDSSTESTNESSSDSGSTATAY